ncbi:Acyl carrier protein [Cystobacter fuscus DSM 2262]|uniref:Acyl carrier protein n=1 Tax=Cystobacter fuscus (strain ATCC 25194 / DSM 2262 / NBRC 100088 / M29) TaxID=1242864 RepID=S9PD16_CYSF2|nr:acyl carrier protein [Cystobacter fuscus]EPX60981.1 Acyl carrier protein [Cystobacter fuscus DSM 2262]
MEISDQLREFIRTTFLRGDNLELSDTTPLITSGLLDSTDALELLLYMESEFDITVGDDEAGPENLDTLERITAFIEAKRAAGGGRQETREGSEPLAR